MKTIYIKWIDSTSYPSWKQKEDMEDKSVLTCESIGFLAKETDEFYSICQSIADDGQNQADHILIPKVCVLEKIDIVIGSKTTVNNIKK